MGSLGSTTHESCARRAVQGRGGGHKTTNGPAAVPNGRSDRFGRRRPKPRLSFVGLGPREPRLGRLSPCLCHNPNMFKNHDPTRFSPVSSLSLACARRRATGGWFSKSRLWPRARIGALQRIPEACPVSPVASPGAILFICAPPSTTATPYIDLGAGRSSLGGQKPRRRPCPPSTRLCSWESTPRPSGPLRGDVVSWRSAAGQSDTACTACLLAIRPPARHSQGRQTGTSKPHIRDARRPLEIHGQSWWQRSSTIRSQSR